MAAAASAERVAAAASSSDQDAHDAWLQDELQRRGSTFRLLPHQPVAVRAVAGVPQDYRGGRAPHAPGAHGLILADDMGAGKTVMVLSGLLLRETFDHGPNLVICPNWAVADQWQEHALRCGIDKASIFIYRDKPGVRRAALEKALRPGRSPPLRLVLTDRYTVMADMADAVKQGDDQHWTPPALAPLASAQLASRLREMYASYKGEYKGERFSPQQRAAALELLQRLDPARGSDPRRETPFRNSPQFPAEGEGVLEALRHEHRAMQRRAAKLPWSAVIVDEAHFMKNPTSWWGMHAQLLSLHARRFVAVTGTPFNTRCCDMGTICAMVDTTQRQAEAPWWDEVFKSVSLDVGDEDEEDEPSLPEVEWGSDAAMMAIPEWERQSLPRDELDRRVAEIREGLKAQAAREEARNLMGELDLWRGPRHNPKGLLRRAKAILNLGLPEKLIHVIEVEPSEAELEMYHKVFSDSRPRVAYDGGPLQEMQALAGDQRVPTKVVGDTFMWTWAMWHGVKYNVPLNRRLERFWFERIMCKVQTLRLLQTHPACYSACGGRELTASFAPSRRKRLDCSQQRCHICGDVMLPVEDEDADADADERADDDDEVDEADAALRRRRARDNDETSRTQPGDLVPYPRKRCGAAKPHLVHRRCLEGLGDQAPDCPRCVELKKFAHVGAHAEEGEDVVVCRATPDARGQPLGGFRLSSKLRELRRLQRHFPQGERAIVFSFFKSFLDLAEAMFEDDGVRCARFDGDDSQDGRVRELKRFKSDPGVGVLLATVHSGGVGLNIVEANRVIFCDRHLNPVVHQQAMDRVHRIGQLKTVHIYYIDGVSPIHSMGLPERPYGTFDEWLRDHQTLRLQQAQIVLADGTSLGLRPTSTKDTMLSGGEPDGIMTLSQRMDNAEDAMKAHSGRWAPGFQHPPPGPRPTHLPGTSAALGSGDGAAGSAAAAPAAAAGDAASVAGAQAPDDLSSSPVRALKRQLDDLGVAHGDCTEKQELVARLRGALAKAPADGPPAKQARAASGEAAPPVARVDIDLTESDDEGPPTASMDASRTPLAASPREVIDLIDSDHEERGPAADNGDETDVYESDDDEAEEPASAKPEQCADQQPRRDEEEEPVGANRYAAWFESDSD